ncbi:MAG: oleate hydratase [Candidatus Tyrphobacter sp.]
MKDATAYLVGGGIASLAAATYLIRDGGFSGHSICVFEETLTIGGSLDAQGSAEKGYVMRGGRMFEEHYACTWDILSSIPSLDDSRKTVKDEIVEFSARFKTESRSRLVEDGKHVDMSSLGFSARDRLALVAIMVQPEQTLGSKRILDCFESSFFETNFWYFYCTTFAFQPWHSAVEFKRYLLRFIHLFPGSGLKELTGVWRTPYNQYDSIVLPLLKWLEAAGVRFELGCQVVDLDFAIAEDQRAVEKIHYTRDGAAHEITINDNDLVFVTIGSMTADSALGSMTTAPVVSPKKSGGAWNLWERVSTKQPDFGRPSVFDDHPNESKWLSFTATFRDPTFFNLMEEFTGNAAGTGGLVTFKDSNWLMSIVLAHQPHFRNQPKGVSVAWGYGLFPDKPGNFVQKPMSGCSGAEILVELCAQLRFNESVPLILETSTCIPCMMPYITSQFMPRQQGDRPWVVPKKSANFAFLGQFCEIPDDVVFTVEYSVRSAQMAVYALLDIDKDVTSLYKGQYDIGILIDSLKTMLV